MVNHTVQGLCAADHRVQEAGQKGMDQVREAGQMDTDQVREVEKGTGQGREVEKGTGREVEKGTGQDLI